MSCKNGYFIQAKPGKYNGHEYASQLEIRCAKLLDKHGIAFTPHQKFAVKRRNGKPFTYNVDFVFDYPQKIVGISKLITFLEVKGVVTPHDIHRMDALKYRTNSSGYIATTDTISMWERCGMRTTIKRIHGG